MMEGKLLIVIFSLACFVSEPPPQKTHALAHYANWSGLVAAVERSDGKTARVLARDLQGPDRAELGSSIGYLLVADEEDLSLGLLSAAKACGSCHVEHGVPEPEHKAESTYQVTIDRLVWGR